MKPPLYKPAVFGCALLLLMAGALLAEVRVPVAKNLQQEGSQAQQRQLPILLAFSADDCSYCELLEEDFLQPMLLGGEYQDRVDAKTSGSNSGNTATETRPLNTALMFAIKW